MVRANSRHAFGSLNSAAAKSKSRMPAGVVGALMEAPERRGAGVLTGEALTLRGRWIKCVTLALASATYGLNPSSSIFAPSSPCCFTLGQLRTANNGENSPVCCPPEWSRSGTSARSCSAHSCPLMLRPPIRNVRTVNRMLSICAVRERGREQSIYGADVEKGVRAMMET